MIEFIKEKWLLIILISIILVFSIVLVFFYFSAKKQPEQLSVPAIPTPVEINKTQKKLSPSEQAKIQTKADENFSKQWADVYKNYPWYKQLPISGNGYFVFFDINKKAIVAKLYPKKNTTISLESQNENLKHEVETALTRIGVNLTNFAPQWIVTPEYNY